MTPLQPASKPHIENRFTTIPIAEEGTGQLELAVHDWYCETVPLYDAGAPALPLSEAVQQCVDDLWSEAVRAKSTAALAIKLLTAKQIRRIIAETSGAVQRGSSYARELDHYQPTIICNARTIVAYARPQLFADAIRSIVATAARELASPSLRIVQTAPLTFRIEPSDHGTRYTIIGTAPAIGKTNSDKLPRRSKCDVL